VDALRGLAALAVVLYHYTQRYGELGVMNPGQFPAAGEPWLRVAWGHYGVQLFFMISGFVILMTVMKVRSVGEFGLLRLARLYPAFWAACVLTFVVMQLWGPPARRVTPEDAGANLTMMPAMVGARSVDVVYWTLQQEMMFYLVMGATLALGLRRWAIAAVAGLVVISLCGVGVIGWHPGPRTPLLPIVDLRWFSLFLSGMVLYDSRERGVKWWHSGLVLLCAADALRHNLWRPDGGTREWGAVWADLISFGLLLVATRWRVPLLANTVLVFLGTVSYCLYLLHQNIGYVVIGKLSNKGVPINAAIAVAIGVAVVLASAVTFLIERPACAWARDFVRRRLQGGSVGAQAPAGRNSS
jgi:peptidoglycan/LPS O-acetylase OafA/YrhL